MTDVHERLRAHMAQEVARTTISDPGGVMARGEQIRRRRQAVMVGLPAIVIVAGVVGAMALPRLGDVDPTDLDRAVAAQAHLSVEIGDLDWDVRPATLGWARETVADGDFIYVLSTAPGTTWQPDMGEVPRAIYASDNGLDWTANPVGGAWVNSISAREGLLYAVGTAPGAEAGTITLQVGTSSDAGGTLETQQLPYLVSAETHVNARVVATGGGILATAESYGDPDVTYEAFWSEDGRSWDQVDYPFPPGSLDRTFTVGDEALVTLWTEGGTRAFASPDGRNWHPVAEDVGLVSIMAIGEIAGRSVIIGAPPQGQGVGVFTAADLNGPWEQIVLDGELDRFIGGQGHPWISSAAIGPAGVAVSLTIERPVEDGPADMVGRILDGMQRRLGGGQDGAAPQAFGIILVSKDLISWQAVPASDIGDWVGDLIMTPDGTLVAHGTASAGNGRSIRQQGSVEP